MSKTYIEANKLFETDKVVKCQKKPILLKFEVIDADKVVKTKEGDVNAFKGQALLTGTKGEQWPIPWDKFESTYSIKWNAIDGKIQDDSGVCWKKPMLVDAVRLKVAFAVKPSWSEDLLHGKPGDYLVKYGENDFGIVADAIFDETYEIK